MSPFQKAIEKAITKKKKEMMAASPQCENAINSGNEGNIAKFCEVPLIDMKVLSVGNVVNPAGKIIGKKIRTETILEFGEPKQRAKKGKTKEKWDRVKLKGFQIGNIGSGAFNKDRQDPNGPRSNGALQRNAVLFPASAVNDDKDCIDMLTGDRLGGLVDNGDPAIPNEPIPDGSDGSCFEMDGSLKQTLVETPEGCAHIGGTILMGVKDDGVEDDCYDEDGNLKTTLEETIDEDGPETLDNDNDGLIDEDPPGDIDGDGNPNDDNDCIDVNGQVFRDMDCFDADGILPDLTELVDEDGADFLDQDADGWIDEDPPATNMMGGCKDFFLELGLQARPEELTNDVGEEECDLTRALIVAVNKKAMTEHGQKAYMADDNGDFDPNVSDAVEFGNEKRMVKLNETFAIMCEDGAELIDGQCVGTSPSTPSAGSGPGLGNPVNLSADEIRSLADGTTSSLTKFAMMGFTFAPPVVEWGFQVQEEACVDLFFGEICFEIFFARIGYEFNIAAGLRLPVEVRIEGIPDPSALAGDAVTLQASLQPVDFTVKQYRDFCQEHRLDQERFISSCERFAFPDFLDALNPLIPDDEKDGDEFVLQETIFAGLIVRVVGIPIIRWGIDAQVDLPTMCTMLKIKEELSGKSLFDLLTFGLDLAKDRDLIQAIKNQLANCASFTTPFGEEPDPTNPFLNRLRVFPFVKSFDIRADCAEALVRKETITIKKKVKPICTGMVLGANGASLGVGLGFEGSVGSKLIKAKWATSEDADPHADDADNEIRFRHSEDEGEEILTIGPIRVDNYDDTPFQDSARIALKDFTYFLNAFQVRVKANLQFGGILSPIPDIGSFTLLNLIVSTGEFGVPIGQHAGTEPLVVSFPVENYGLEVEVKPETTDPELRVDEKTRLIKPGEFGDYIVKVKNIGSFSGGFDAFNYALSNRPDSTVEPFIINPNNDFDCEDAAKNHFTGNPYNGVADDCYDGSGDVRSDRIELIDEDPIGPAGAPESVRDQDQDGVADEDPVDNWATAPSLQQFNVQQILAVPPNTESTPPPTPPGQSLVLSINPFKHPTTSPGRYAFRVTADSIEAKLLGLDDIDPSGNLRLGASDIAFFEVISFFDPQIVIVPIAPQAKPGVPITYTVEGTNAGNDVDKMSVSTEFVDFNQAGCNLTTLGKLPEGSEPDCPFRAVPTVIPAFPDVPSEADWTTIRDLPAEFPSSSPPPFLDPLGTDRAPLTILPPQDWAGMEDTTYQFITTVVSQQDPESPPAANSIVGEQIVIATSESMTRYIGLEIGKLVEEIERANAEGIQTGGLLFMAMFPSEIMNNRALDLVLAGKLNHAGKAHSANIRIVQGFLSSLNGFNGNGGKIPESFASDWRSRAEAIVEDLGIAAASNIPSVP